MWGDGLSGRVKGWTGTEPESASIQPSIKGEIGKPPVFRRRSCCLNCRFERRCRPNIYKINRSLLSRHHCTRSHSVGLWRTPACRDNGHDLFLLHHRGINNAWCGTLLGARTPFHIVSWGERKKTKKTKKKTPTTATIRSPALAFQFWLSTRP